LRFRSGDGFEGDLVAERGELGEVVASSCVDTVGVVVGAEVVETTVRVREQVPDDDEDRSRDRDELFELASALTMRRYRSPRKVSVRRQRRPR
jgi:hypothetical protein